MNRFFLKIFVLAAILVVFSALILSFTSANVVSIPQISEVETVSTESFERDGKLQSETDALLPLFDKMPSVPVYMKDEIINREGTNTERGVAYTNCESSTSPIIFVKKIFYEKANQKQLVNILKHELTHAWLCRRQQMSGHDARFREKFKQVGGFGN